MNTLAKRSIVAAIAALVPVSAAHAVVETFSNGVGNDFSTGLYSGTRATTLLVASSNTNDDANNGGSTVLRTQSSSGNRYRIIMSFDLSAITPYASQITLSTVGLGLTQAFTVAGDATTYPLVVNTFNPLNAGWLQGSGTGTIASTTGPWATGNNYAAKVGSTAAVAWKNTNGSGSGTLSGSGSTTGPFQSLYNQSGTDANVYVGGNALGTHYTETDSTGKFKTAVSNWISTPAQNAGMFFSNGGNSANAVEFYNDNTATVANRPGLQLTISSPTMVSNWVTDGSDTWPNGGNWDNGSPNSVGATANFGNVISAPATVNVASPQVVSAVNFDSVQGYTLTGSSAITLLEVNAGQVNINVSSGSHTITTPVVMFTNTTIGVASGSSLEVDGPVSAAAKTVTVTGPGKLVLGSTSVLNALAGSGGATLNVNGGVVAIKPHTGADTAAAPTALTLNNGATLDVTNNDLVYAYTGTNSPADAIRSMLVSGYNSGTWDGSGIATSSASAMKGLGYAEAADVGITTFDGVSVTNAVLVKYTYYGDSSLDGKVDLGNDFDLFLIGLLSGGNTWELGDYNYDGTVDMNDFQLFVDGISGQGVPLGDLQGLIAGSAVLSAGQRAEMLSFVPEPASLSGCAALAGVAALRRRRNRE